MKLLLQAVLIFGVLWAIGTAVIFLHDKEDAQKAVAGCIAIALVTVFFGGFIWEVFAAAFGG